MQVSPRDLLPADEWYEVTWISPIVELFDSNAILGEHENTRLNLEPDGLYKWINYWIERRLRLKTPFWLLLSRNNDGALLDIIINE